MITLFLSILVVPDIGHTIFLSSAVLPAALAGFAGLSSLIGGLASANAQREANRINMEQFNALLKNSQYQYEDSKRYNSAAQQVGRLRAAGMNPSLTFSGDAGSVSSNISPSMNPIQGEDYTLAASAGSRFADVLNQTLANQSTINLQGSQSAKNVAETTGLSTDNIYKPEYWRSLNASQWETAFNLKSVRELNEKTLKYMDEETATRIENLRTTVELQKAQWAAQMITNEYIPKQLQASIDNTLMTAKAAVLSGQASVKQALASVMNAKTTKNAMDAQYGSSSIERHNFFKATLDFLLERGNESRSNQYKNWMSPVLGGVVSVPHSVGSYQAGETVNRQVKRNRQ